MVLTFLYFHTDWLWDRYLDTFRVREHAGLSQHASKQPERFGTAMPQSIGFEAPKYPKELWGERKLLRRGWYLLDSGEAMCSQA